MSSALLAESLALPCGAVLPNRLAKAALTEGLADPLSRPDARLQTLYRAWSQGGAGLVITGNVQVDRRYQERPGNVCIDGLPDADSLRALSAWAEAAQQNGNHCWVQLSHAGRQSTAKVNYNSLGPSAIPIDMGAVSDSWGTPREITQDEIRDVIDRFVNAARVCKEAGFKGVQIHGAHGYLLSSFLNPLANQRTDDYGGVLENRARLLVDVVRAVRVEVGPNYPVGVKLNSSDFQKGGFTLEEATEVVKMLENEGVDLLEISGGNYESAAMMNGPDVRESTRVREAYFFKQATDLRQHLTSMKLMVTGGFRSVQGMNESLSSGIVDVIGLGRPLISMPDAPNRIFKGEITELPKWEDHLKPGTALFRKLTSRFPALKSIDAAVVAVYHRNTARISVGKRPNGDMGVLRQFVWWERTDSKVAYRMAGMVVKGQRTNNKTLMNRLLFG
eukprot:comp4870_c0_seq1/m.981 comp4870_c0_seq1/g.981  ORF comp4870_c0_seq1/g.981 comp4870_c0_seq1/m.981 type:complete len:447 (-) comp4870_c0_seq1:751-2091(-)